LKFRIYRTFIRLWPPARTFIVISHINILLALRTPGGIVIVPRNQSV
jgi:hypothetical protein